MDGAPLAYASSSSRSSPPRSGSSSSASGADGAIERSLLRELKRCKTLGKKILRDGDGGEAVVEVRLARFDFRYGAIVRGAFGHLDELAALGGSAPA